MTTYIFLGEMLSELRAAWSAYGEELLLQSRHVSLHETETEVEYLVGGRGARLHEAIGDFIALLVQHEAVEDGG